MTLLAFILGLTVGIVVCFIRQRQLNRQLQRMLYKLTDGTAEVASLSTISRLRREISRAYQHRQELETQIQIGENLLEIAPVGYLQVDEENHLIKCNQQARQLLNVDRWQPGQQVRLFLELVRSYELDQLIEQTRQSQQPQMQEWVFYSTNLPDEENTEVKNNYCNLQKSLPLKAYSLPLPQGQVGVFLENQQSLVQLQEVRDRAFSDLTHELRTPLTSILLVAEALETRLEGIEKRWVRRMQAEVNRLIHLIQDWLDISQLAENPTLYLNYQSFDLRELIASVWQTLEPIAKQKQLTLAYTGSPRIDLKADRDRLTQVFLNLLDNGIKHSPPETKIQVETKLLDNQRIQINIIDTGNGFQQSDLPHVFDRLYRGDKSRQRSLSESESKTENSWRRGSGLGLSIAQQIIIAHGGSIQAKNHPTTQGAWLEIELPTIPEK
ncbi:MAG: PAS domain-containing sensor histidine kinase [Oscillatoria sp. PMC 1068.18]|nr:PAS domain-containing sensor histidine kinase [Oscillatoria sp. PMC 1076.18]MEC4989336.1 PAS domain-containing sensor histidine kinase [Oscillatoria sp. PMC 1068.18]